MYCVITHIFIVTVRCSRTTLLNFVFNKCRDAKGLHCTKQSKVVLLFLSQCFLCCLWITSWLGMSMGNYQDLLICLSYSFAFFHCRTAFNYHTESPFTEIMRERPKASKSPHYTVKHYIQEKQILHYTHSFSLHMFSIKREKNSTVAYHSLF